ncbi:MAG TPA: 23S rRNA (adenine(2503)-C(2))-methyltransferase RlmN [Phycisphaerae bacterium]|nr:23S rRNA (adenine(2503)-C(2))-methyltransferase RlmN [Phycisphaerae bacterium]
MSDTPLSQGDSRREAADAPRRIAVFGETLDSLTGWLQARGHKRFRAGQILEWIYRHGAESFEDMTNLPKRTRAELADWLDLFESQVVARSEARDGTIKLLLRWGDATTTECVLIPDGARRTACISTQVGCPVGCVFCASGLDGLQRNLTTAEIVEQAVRISRLCRPERLTNVVFMGLGEPLANYASTVGAVRTINAEWGPHVAARKITVSTVGLPKQMRRLAGEGLQITLALSLHAPTEELRQRLIPWAERITLDELVSAARFYFDSTGREVTLEYILLGGVNDEPSHARELAGLAKQMRCNVNLIPYNPVPSLPYVRPSEESQQAFLHGLRAQGINAHLRHSRGLEVDAACGQLRRRRQTVEVKGEK